jgi:drug/metabolite transporter (DMT)-like permease
MSLTNLFVKETALALAVLGVIGTAFSMLIMNSLIRYTSAVFASSVTYIIPVFAILWGLLDRETITIFHLMFMGLVLVGVYLINRKS